VQCRRLNENEKRDEIAETDLKFVHKIVHNFQKECFMLSS
jgi:hypothetical protein